MATEQNSDGSAMSRRALTIVSEQEAESQQHPRQVGRRESEQTEETHAH